MNEKILNKLLTNKSFLDNKIAFYKGKNVLTKTDSKYEIKGHLQKARHNLFFSFKD